MGILVVRLNKIKNVPFTFDVVKLILNTFIFKLYTQIDFYEFLFWGVLSISLSLSINTHINKSFFMN